MGLRDLTRRLSTSVHELDNERIQDRFHGLALTAVADIPLRCPMRVGGEVKRLRHVPRSGTPTLEVVLNDGTGDVTAVFAGRRSIPGIEHGRAMVVEGVAYAERGRIVTLNPAYTLLGPVEH